MGTQEGVFGTICEIATAECISHFGRKITALVLTGSLARQEATLTRNSEGWMLMGDAEFLVVIPRDAGLPYPYVVEDLEERIAAKLLLKRIQATIDLAVVYEKYFRRLPPHIFTYELRTFAKVIWGEQRVLDLIPAFTPDRIPQEDAWRMLSNRMIEHLQYVDDLLNRGTQLTPRLHYATIKLFLDMGTSYLVFANGYEPTYRGRAERLDLLAKQKVQNRPAPFCLKEFASRVASCTAWKLAGGGMQSDLRLEFWAESIRYASSLWTWEAIQMTKGAPDLSPGTLETELALKLTPLQKIRGWVHVVNQSGGLKSWREWLRWFTIGLRTTPRYSIYRVAAELFRNLPQLISSDGAATSNPKWQELSLLLPTKTCGSRKGHEDWRILLNDVVVNYQKFVAGTRA